MDRRAHHRLAERAGLRAGRLQPGGPGGRVVRRPRRGREYFSQQAVDSLAPRPGIDLPGRRWVCPSAWWRCRNWPTQGDARAARIYETIGVYLGYAHRPLRRFLRSRAHADPRARDHRRRAAIILVGRRARCSLAEEFPALAERDQRLHVPDEKSRRVGQAVAAASLPGCAKARRINRGDPWSFKHPAAEIFIPDGRAGAEALGRTTHLGSARTRTTWRSWPSTASWPAFSQRRSMVRRRDLHQRRRQPAHAALRRLHRRGDDGACAAASRERPPCRRVRRHGPAGLPQLRGQGPGQPAPGGRPEGDPAGDAGPRWSTPTTWPTSTTPTSAWPCAVIQALRDAAAGAAARSRSTAAKSGAIWTGCPTATKSLLDVGGHENLPRRCSGVFDSQIAGGKRYDLATHGPAPGQRHLLRIPRHGHDRRRSCFAMDLTPLVADDPRSTSLITSCGFIDRFRPI